MAAAKAPATSATYVKSRVCVPSPTTVSGFPAIFWARNTPNTAPYVPLVRDRGPNTLNSRSEVVWRPYTSPQCITMRSPSSFVSAYGIERARRRRLGRGIRIGNSIARRRCRVHDLPHPGGARGLAHGERALDVRGVIVGRALDRRDDIGQSGQMKNAGGTAEGRRERFGTGGDIGFDEREARRTLRAGKVLTAAARKIVDHHDFVLRREQRVRQVAPDEPGAARYHVPGHATTGSERRAEPRAPRCARAVPGRSRG